MQPILKAFTSKFFHHYQTILSEKQKNNVTIQISRNEEREYSEKERRLSYQKIGSNVEIVENVTIIDNNFTEQLAVDDIEFKVKKRDMKKMYY